MIGLDRPLLERSDELGRLARALVALREGRGHSVVIEGPAGIGKTALVEAMANRAGKAGIRVLRARGGELERDDPFGVVAQLFGPPLPDEALDGLPAAAAAAVRAGESVIAPPGEDVARAASHGLFALCVRLTEAAPLLIALDDAHWADDWSLRWLLFLARRLDRLGVALVIARRSRELGAKTELLDRLVMLDGTELLRPAPLTADATTELVRDALGKSAEPRFCEACQRATGGNPFLLGALIAELMASGVTPTAESAKLALSVGPRSVARSALLALARAPSAAMPLARAVAVLEEAELRDAARVAGLDERTALTAAAALGDAGLLAPGSRMRYAHPLLRAAIYTDIDERERAHYHRAAARALADAGAAPERVAAHVLNSAPSGEPEAVLALRSAARRSYANGAPDAAARYLRRALAEPPLAGERPIVMLELGRAEVRAGEPDAVAHLEASVAQAAGDGLFAARALRELARAHMLAGRMTEATAAFERAVGLAGADRELRLALEGELAATLANVTTARDAASRLEAYRDVRGETPGERTVLALLAFAAVQQNESASVATALLERALGSGEFVSEQTAGTVTFADAMIAMILVEQEQRCLEMLEPARADAQRLGWSIALAAAPFFQAWAHLRLGALEAACECAHVSLAVSDERGWQAYTPMAAAVLCEAELERGRVEAGAAALGRINLPEEVPDSALFQLALCARGLLRAGRGELERARDDLLLCGRREVALGGVTPAALAWRSHAALASARLGEDERARQLAGEELSLAREFGAPRALGIALRSFGLIIGGAEGIDALAEASSVLADSSAKLERARALCDLGAALRRANHRRDARKPLSEAIALATECGAEPLTQRARSELLAAGGRPRRSALRGPGALTPSERRVAELAAAGHGNREIAAELVVSIRTIEFHLSRAYAKLDVGARSELPDALNGTDAA